MKLSQWKTRSAPELKQTQVYLWPTARCLNLIPLELWVHCLAKEARNWSGGDELYVQKFRHFFRFIWNGNGFAFRRYKDKYVE